MHVAFKQTACMHACMPHDMSTCGINIFHLNCYLNIYVGAKWSKYLTAPIQRYSYYTKMQQL